MILARGRPRPRGSVPGHGGRLQWPRRPRAEWSARPARQRGRDDPGHRWQSGGLPRWDRDRHRDDLWQCRCQRFVVEDDASFPRPWLVMRAITPGYPLRPRGKERGGPTLVRPTLVCNGTTRPLPPPASSRPAGGILILLDQDRKIIRQASDDKSDLVNSAPWQC